MKMDIKTAQKVLADASIYAGKIDGLAGPILGAAVSGLLTATGFARKLSPRADPLVAAVQYVLQGAGFEPGEVDGFFGHNTLEALNAFTFSKPPGGGVELIARVAQSDAPKVAPGWPDQKGVDAFFGKAGGAQCTAGLVQLPFSFRLAWDTDTPLNYFRSHEKVSAALTSIFLDAGRAYGEARFRQLGLDLFGGCYNYRKMRGGTALSMHSWGIAVDLDPERNQLRWGKDKAAFAGLDYVPFWNIVEAHGAVSLGRTANLDFMHFQFATL